MANIENTAFPVFLTIQDDSKYVHQAMRELEFFGEFSDLTIVEMQCVLLVAEYYKRSAAQADEWES